MHGKEGQRETEAEPGEMHLQGKECEGPRCRQRPGGRKEARPPPVPPFPGARSGGRGSDDPRSLQWGARPAFQPPGLRGNTFRLL